MDLIKEKAKTVKKSVSKKQVPKAVVKKAVSVKATVIETKTISDNLHQNHTNVPAENAKVIEEPVKKIVKKYPFENRALRFICSGYDCHFW